MSTKHYIYQIENLTKKHGQKVVLQDVNLAFYPGAKIGVLGPNGAGKSTLLKIMAGLVRPTSGRVTWRMDGTTLEGPEWKRRMGFSGPYIDLYPDLSCADNLSFIAALRGLDQPDVETVLSEIGLPEVADQPYGSLSSGQKQRMRLASSTFFNPDVLFLDEPGSNLDRNGAAVVRQVLATRRDRGWMTILASNDPDELSQCDQIIQLAAG